jgi:hypothetical protein
MGGVKVYILAFWTLALDKGERPSSNPWKQGLVNRWAGVQVMETEQFCYDWNVSAWSSDVGCIATELDGSR